MIDNLGFVFLMDFNKCTECGFIKSSSIINIAGFVLQICDIISRGSAVELNVVN